MGLFYVLSVNCSATRCIVRLTANHMLYVEPGSALHSVTRNRLIKQKGKGFLERKCQLL